MNHKYLPSIGQKHCAICKRGVIDHTKAATCEACSNTGECELIGTMLLCESCQAKENTTQSIPPVVIETKTTESLIGQINKVAESTTVKSLVDSAIKGNIKQYTDFFNASMPSILSLKELIDSTPDISNDEKHYELARALADRIKHLTEKLFEARTTEIQMSAEVKSIQQYMNQLIPQLRIEKRAEFAANNIDYQPTTPKEVKAPKVRLSTEDKLAEGYAKLMKIPIEQAKMLMRNKLKDSCTCKVTPGICVVHK
uniref:Uncharacterized protein n=1 Tax=viral metagenome TaxID=1070528 RepID=A0A6M3L914_9ZZZZ